MLYPTFITPGDDKHAFGVAVPDLPGCFSAGDTLLEAMINVREAAAMWLEDWLDEGNAVPEASAAEDYLAEYAGWFPSIVEVDLDEILGESERINISLPKRVLRRLDAQAEKANVNRSAYIAQLAMEHS